MGKKRPLQHRRSRLHQSADLGAYRRRQFRRRRRDVLLLRIPSGRLVDDERLRKRRRGFADLLLELVEPRRVRLGPRLHPAHLDVCPLGQIFDGLGALASGARLWVVISQLGVIPDVLGRPPRRGVAVDGFAEWCERRVRSLEFPCRLNVCGLVMLQTRPPGRLVAQRLVDALPNSQEAVNVAGTVSIRCEEAFGITYA